MYNKNRCPNKLLILLLFFSSVVYAQPPTEDYLKELLETANQAIEEFYSYCPLEEKLHLAYQTLQEFKEASWEGEKLEQLSGYIHFYNLSSSLQKFLVRTDSLKMYANLVTALQLFIEYYGLNPQEEIRQKLTYYYCLQHKLHLRPYIHYGIYKDNIFQFAFFTPGFNYFEDYTCFMIEATNNSTNEINFDRFIFIIFDKNQSYKEINLKANPLLLKSLPLLPDGYFLGKLSRRESRRVLKLFPKTIKEDEITKVVMQDTLSDFSIEAIFFENF